MADRVRVGRQTAQSQFERKALYAEDVVTDSGVSVEEHIGDLWTAIQGGGVGVPVLVGRVVDDEGHEHNLAATANAVTAVAGEDELPVELGMNTAIYDGQELIISRW